MLLDAFNIFISYRRQDHKIAEALNNQIREWGVPKANIFSFNEEDQGLRPDEPINNGLIEKLKETDLFLMIYTIEEGSWSYCMMELGIALGHGTRKTSVVLFQCTDDVPNIRQDRRLIDIRKEKDCFDFVKQFHTEPSFTIPDNEIRSSSGALFETLSKTDPEIIERRSKSFLEAMRVSAPSGRRIERHRLDYIEFELDALYAEEVRSLRDSARNSDSESEYKALRGNAIEILRQHVLVHPAPRSVQRGLDAFGVGALERPISLGNLLKRWAEENSGESFNDSKITEEWHQLLLEDFSRATALNPSRRENYSFQSAYSNTLLRPVIVKCSADGSGSMVYSMYLFALDLIALET